jgi:hypothetical protein
MRFAPNRFNHSSDHDIIILEVDSKKVVNNKAKIHIPDSKEKETEFLNYFD